MSSTITEHEVDMREIVCRFYPHPQYPDEGYYQIQTSGGVFLGNVGVDDLDCELATMKKQGWINNKLALVTFAQNGVINIQYYRGKGCKCSERVYKYLDLLKAAIDGMAG